MKFNPEIASVLAQWKLGDSLHFRRGQSLLRETSVLRKQRAATLRSRMADLFYLSSEKDLGRAV